MPAFDATTTTAFASLAANPRNHSHTSVGSTNLALLFSIFVKDAVTLTGTPTVGGVAATLLQDQDTAGNGIRGFLYGFAGQATGAVTIAHSMTDTTEASTINVISFTDASQVGGTTTFPNGNKATGITSTPSLTVTSAVGQLVAVLNGSASNTAPTIGATGTQRYNAVQAPGRNFGATATGAASVVVDWTGAGTSMSIAWVCTGCSVAAPAGTQNQLAWITA